MKRKNINYVGRDSSDFQLSVGNKLALAVGGIIVGIISGLFGGGGGIIIIPLLTYIGHLDEKSAHATSIAIVLPIVIVSVVVYFLNGIQLEYLPTVGVAVGVMIGGLMGTFLLRKLSSNVLRIVFYLIMMTAGIRMLI